MNANIPTDMKSLGQKALLALSLILGTGIIETASAIPPPPGPPSIGAPLDASVVLLLVLGTIYGVLKVYSKNKVA